jgi:hypothetical protein
MIRKLTMLILAGVFLCGIFTLNVSAQGFERLTPQKISADQIVASSAQPPAGDKGFCLIQSDNDDIAYFFADFLGGDGFALYMDPAMCG